LYFPAEFFDYRLNNLAAQLSPGWVRYPSGLFSNAFNWQTGLMDPSWAAQFKGTNVATLLAEGVFWVNGKGGGSFVDAANRANFLNAKLIVLGQRFHRYGPVGRADGGVRQGQSYPGRRVGTGQRALSLHRVLSIGRRLRGQSKPYRDAIKAADPSAVVAIFFMDAGDTNPKSGLEPGDRELPG